MRRVVHSGPGVCQCRVVIQAPIALLKPFLPQAMNLREAQISSLASETGSPTLGPTYRKLFDEWKPRKLTSSFSVQWHSAFWGKAMANDKDWLNTQLPIASVLEARTIV